MLSKNQLSEIRKLHHKKGREEDRLFIAEGFKTVNEIVGSRPKLIQAVYGTDQYPASQRSVLASYNIRFFEADEHQMEKISLQQTPSGVLAVCSFMDEPSVRFDPENQFALYLDDIRDPGNMGTIIRLADWFGVSKVFCSVNSCEFYNPKVIQSSMGAFLRVNPVYTSLDRVIAENGIKHVYGAVLEGKNLYREKLRNGLLVIGNESNGISEANLQLINESLTIPAHSANGTESLNAAMAAAVFCSEFFRQLKC